MVSFILFLNRFFRRPNVEGRESDTAYSEWEHKWGSELVRTYMEPAGDVRGKTVLDIGCGLGGKTVSYGEGGAAQAFGTDISLDHIAASHNYAAREERSFLWAFFAADASSLPVTSGVIDTIVANDAMEHFAAPDVALSEIYMAVKRGGSVWLFFTPHFSPLGSHLYDYIYTPWCHLIFRRQDLKGAILKVLEKRMSGMAVNEIEGELEKIMSSYDKDLNHMSIHRFFKMVRQIPGFQVSFKELKPAKFSFLKILTAVPLIRELFTGTVICRLTRVE